MGLLVFHGSRWLKCGLSSEVEFVLDSLSQLIFSYSTF